MIGNLNSKNNNFKTLPKAIIFDMHDTLLTSKNGGDITTDLTRDLIESGDLTYAESRDINLMAKKDLYDNKKDIHYSSLKNIIFCKGAPEMVNWCKKNKIKIGILTLSPRYLAEKCLKGTGLENCPMVCFKDLDRKYSKPHKKSALFLIEKMGKNILPEEVLYVGDSWMDYLCANSAGTKFRGFATRESKYEQLCELVSDEFVLRDYKDLINYFEKISN